MRISKIVLNGLKGQSAEYEIGPLTVLVGPNGSGKTALLQGVMFAILGFDPKLGKSASALLPMIAGSEMSVRLEVDLDDGERFVVFRRLGKKNGSSKQTLRVSPSLGETTISAVTAKVEATLGSFPVMFDLGEFLALSDDRRRQFLFHLASPSGGSTEGLWSRVVELLAAEIRGTPDLLEDAHSAFETHRRKAGHEGALSEHDYVGRVAALLKEEESTTGAMAKQYQNGLQAMTDELAGLSASGSSRELRGALEYGATQIQVATRELEVARGQLGEQRRRQDRLRLIADRKRELGVSFAGLLEEMRATLAEAEQALAAEEGALKEARERDGIAQETLREAEQQERHIAVRLAGFRTEVETIRGMVEGLGGCGLVEDPRCAFQAKRATLASRVQAVEAETKAFTEVVEATANATIARGQAARAVRERDAALPKLRGRVGELRHLVAERERLEAEKEIERRVLDEEEKRLGEAPVAVIPDLEVLEKHLEALQARRTKVVEAFGQVSRREALEKATAESRGLLEKSQRRLESLKALRLAVGPRGLQGQLALGVLGPLVEAANTVLGGLPAGKRLGVITVNDRGAEVFDLGWERAGQVVPFEVLSTGERLQFAAAISVGLLALRKPPLRVLLVDDMQNVDLENRGPFVESLYKLLDQGLVDNVVVASVVPVAVGGLPGVVVHDLERSKEEGSP